MARVKGATMGSTITDGMAPIGRDGARGEVSMPGIRIVDFWRDRPGPTGAQTHVILEILDDALNGTQQFISMRDRHELAGVLRRIAPSAARRAKVLDRVQAKDGVALVDALVEAAITHAGSTVGETVAALHRGDVSRVTLDPPGRPRVKAWLSDGRLVCSFDLSPELRWTSDRLLVRVPLAETIKVGMNGKSVHSVAVHPMLPEATRISSHVSIDGECEFRLRSATRVVRRGEVI